MAVANVYGQQVGKTLNEEVILTPFKKDEVVYAMANGSMILQEKVNGKK